MNRAILVPTVGLVLLAFVTGAGAYAAAGWVGTAVAAVVWMAVTYEVLGVFERQHAQQRGLRR